MKRSTFASTKLLGNQKISALTEMLLCRSLTKSGGSSHGQTSSFPGTGVIWVCSTTGGFHPSAPGQHLVINRDDVTWAQSYFTHRNLPHF